MSLRPRSRPCVRARSALQFRHSQTVSRIHTTMRHIDATNRRKAGRWNVCMHTSMFAVNVVQGWSPFLLTLLVCLRKDNVRVCV